MRVRIGERVIAWWQHADIGKLAHETRDWNDASWAAARFAVQAHGLGPWLHVRLHAAAPSTRVGQRAAIDGCGLPSFLAFLAHCHEMNVRRHALWRSELELVLAAAASLGLPLVALKGAALLPTLWTDPVLRPTSDIDLLTRSDDRAALEPALRELGWTFQGDVPRHRVFYLTRLGIHPRPDVGEHPDQPLRLELHEQARQTFLGLQHDCTGALWRDTSSVHASVHGGDAVLAVPAPGVLFEHVLLHTAFDLARRMTRLIKLEDLRLLASRLSPGDWSRLVANARATGLERFFLAPLIMAERYLGPVAPPDVMDALERATPSDLIAWLRRAPLSYFTVCGSFGAGLSNVWARLRWLPPGSTWLGGARRLVMPSHAERLDEFAPVDRSSSLWAYYRAQLARWRG
jgi:hypothetical protein